MMSIGEFWRRIHYLLHRSRFERELADEMAAHRAMKVPEEIPFGNVLRLREESRDAWGWSWLDRLAQDLTFGARILRRSPAFALAAITVLTLGVGTNLAAFQVLNAIAWHPLPVRDPGSLVRFDRRSRGGASSAFSYPAFDFYSRHNTVLAASMGVHSASVSLADDAARGVLLEFVTTSYLSELGAVPALGRLLQAGDSKPDAEPVIVLSYSLWQRRFGGDPAVIGQSLRVNDRPLTVAGVAASSFVGITGQVAQAWMPIEKQAVAFPGSDLLTSERNRTVWFFARVKSGLTAAMVQDNLKAAAAALREQGPDAAWEGEWLQARPAALFAPAPLGGKGGAAVLIAAAFGILLLLAACANLAVLMLARGFSREREIAIRLSVGATRRRIFRQLLTESGLLSLIGTACGLALSFVVARIALSFAGMPAFLQPTLDIRVGLFSFGIAVAAAALFGVAPALQAIRPKPSRAATRGILVSAQVATGCMLLVLGGLLIRGLQHVITTPLGFEYEEHLTIRPRLHMNGFKPPAARVYWAALRARLEHVPGVNTMALTTWAPLGTFLRAERIPNGATAFFHHVDPAYFEVMGIPLLRGRSLGDGDRDSAVVSDSFARAMWPGEDPLGKLYDGNTVVGVVGNARTLAVGDPAATELYMAMDDEHIAAGVLIVRVATEPKAALSAIVAAAQSVDPRVTPSVGLLRDALDDRLRPPRQMALVVSTLGMLALIVAAIGLSGLLSFDVSQRVREIGIRMALGAQSRDVVRDVIRQFVWPIVGGVAAGLASAAALSSVLRHNLFGLSSLDPVSYIAAALLFSCVALLAAAGPLRRATRVNPIVALRCD
jgi:predicted permease